MVWDYKNVIKAMTLPELLEEWNNVTKKLKKDAINYREMKHEEREKISKVTYASGRRFLK